MKRGGRILCGVAVLAIAACAGNPGKLEVRPTSTRLAEGVRPVPFRVAEARGQLALGNIGLALESFRKALRDEPQSIDALAGIAECYDRMGRFDLSRKNYEAALAIAPADPRLLGALAQSLDQQGRSSEAAEIRSEIAQRLAVATSPEPGTDVAMTSFDSIAMKTAAPPETSQQALSEQLRPVATAAEVTIAVADPRLVPSAPAALPSVHVGQIDSGLAAEQTAAVAAAPVPSNGQGQMLTVAEPSRSVTIKLPPPRPATAPVMLQAQASVAKVSVAPVFADAAVVPASTDPIVPSSRVSSVKPPVAGPRLERLSMAEVALITTGDIRWRSELVGNTGRSAKVRFVPLRQNEQVAEVRLLNAARVHRLAARTRAYLAGRGWRSVSIGDADSTRARSIIFYPEGQHRLARRLSKQFGFAIARREEMEQVTVLLGRDSIRIAGARAGA